jgi:hypothetical protein
LRPLLLNRFSVDIITSDRVVSSFLPDRRRDFPRQSGHSSSGLPYNPGRAAAIPNTPCPCHAQPVSASRSGVKLTLSDFKTEVQKLRDAWEYSELLDNYQYQMCRACRNLRRDDEEWRKYNKIRIGAFHILTSLQATLIAFKSDPYGQKPKVYKVVGDLQDYFLLVAREVIPNIEDVESKSYISKGDLPVVTPGSVSRALSIAGLQETEVDQLVEDLKSSE